MQRAFRSPFESATIIETVLVSVILAGLLFVTGAPSSNRSRAAGSVSVASSMAAPRAGHTATTLPDGQVLMAGGMERNGVFLASCELYEPASGRFSPAAGMLTRRVSHTATLLANGQLLIAGGLEGRYREHGQWKGRAVASAELYDHSTGTFTPKGAMTTSRSSHAAVLLPDGKVLIAGGSDGEGNLASAELFDPATGRFTATGPMSTARIPHVMVLLKDGKVLVAGGTGPDGRVLASAEVYDPLSRRFTPVGSMSTARHKHAAAVLPDGRVLILGGSDERDWRGQNNTAELCDPTTARFHMAGRMNAARFKFHSTVLVLKNGKVLIAGGAERVEVYDPATGSFLLADGGLDKASYFAAAALLPNGSVVITGGYGNTDEATTAAWIYRP